MASARSDAVVMTSVYPPVVDYCKTTIGGLRVGSQFVNLYSMSADAKKPEYPEVGLRLAAIRQAESSMNQKEWAEKHGFGVTQYNNWEKGIRRITVDEAERLCARYGLTLDFIYRGILSGVPESIKNRL